MTTPTNEQLMEVVTAAKKLIERLDEYDIYSKIKYVDALEMLRSKLSKLSPLGTDGKPWPETTDPKIWAYKHYKTVHNWPPTIDDLIEGFDKAIQAGRLAERQTAKEVNKIYYTKPPFHDPSTLE